MFVISTLCGNHFSHNRQTWEWSYRAAYRTSSRRYNCRCGRVAAIRIPGRDYTALACVEGVL